MDKKTKLDIDWINQGACRGQSSIDFYAEHTSSLGRMEQKRAVSVCQNCSVVSECRDYALRYERFGVWGGMTEIQRTKERKRLNIIPELDRFNMQTFLPRTNRPEPTTTRKSDERVTA